MITSILLIATFILVVAFGVAPSVPLSVFVFLNGNKIIFGAIIPYFAFLPDLKNLQVFMNYYTIMFHKS